MSALELVMMKRVGELNAEVKQLKIQLTDCKAEADRLKVEVEQLKEGNEYLNQIHDKEMERSAYLCEQVKRLEAFCTRTIIPNELLQAEVERLTNLQSGADYFKAKEGKQS